MSAYLQVIGLVIDIIGVGFMAWDLVYYDEKALGTWDSLEGDNQRKEKRKVKRNTLIGLGLIAVGFILQIVAVLV